MQTGKRLPMCMAQHNRRMTQDDFTSVGTHASMVESHIGSRLQLPMAMKLSSLTRLRPRMGEAVLRRSQALVSLPHCRHIQFPRREPAHALDACANARRTTAAGMHGGCSWAARSFGRRRRPRADNDDDADGRKRSIGLVAPPLLACVRDLKRRQKGSRGPNELRRARGARQARGSRRAWAKRYRGRRRGRRHRG